jgi:hypothetical protein
MRQKVFRIMFECLPVILFTNCGVMTPRNTAYTKQFPMPSYELNTGSRSYEHAPVEKGTIVTTKNDSLNGFVKLIYYPYGDHIPILPFGKTTGGDVVNTKRRDIQYIRVYNDSGQTKFTYYVNIDFDGLWRVLGNKNGNGVYDNFDGMGNAQKYSTKRMILVTGKEKLLMYNSMQKLFQSRYSYLLKFINKRYHKKYNKEYFKDEKAEIEFILDNEK